MRLNRLLAIWTEENWLDWLTPFGSIEQLIQSGCDLNVNQTALFCFSVCHDAS
jgi:hypothetical protein